MAKKLYPEESVQAIADAIRDKNGEHSTYKIADMADALDRIVMFVGDESQSEGGYTEFICNSLYDDEYTYELCDKADDCAVYLNGKLLPYKEDYSYSSVKSIVWMDSDSEETVTCGLQVTIAPKQSIYQVTAIFLGTSVPDSVEVSVKGIDVSGKVEVEALNVDANGTYTADKGKAYSPITVDVPPSFVSTYELLYEGDVQVSTESSASVADISISGSYTSDLIFVRIYDKAGPRQGYFYQSLSWFVNSLPLLSSTSSYYPYHCVISYTPTLRVEWYDSRSHLGVFTEYVTSPGSLHLSARYVATGSGVVGSGIIDGTYRVEVYKLKLPDGSSSPFPSA